MRLVEIVPKENEFLQETTVWFIIENTLLILAQIAGATVKSFYDLKMENFTIIRKVANNCLCILAVCVFK